MYLYVRMYLGLKSCIPKGRICGRILTKLCKKKNEKSYQPPYGYQSVEGKSVQYR